jgi:adenylate kinase family enzyme
MNGAKALKFLGDSMDQKITLIKNWIGTGSINVFGLPFSGKDTVGVRLAELIGAKFLSSGLILRAAEKEDSVLAKELGAGNLAPTETFRNIILPYFSREELANSPLVLSSVGRWAGEEEPVMEAARNGGHEIKAVILLNISEEEARKTINKVDEMREYYVNHYTGTSRYDARNYDIVLRADGKTEDELVDIIMQYIG